MSDGRQQNTHLKSILVKAKNEALAGGIPGMVAMSAQVVSLMWLRTTVNYQYRYGTSTATAFKTLYKDGGIARFYRGIGPALIQGPLSRFGDTAANSGMLSLLESFESTRDLPLGIKTVASSLSAASFLTRCAAAWLWTRIRSCSSWRSPPAVTACIRMFSVA